MVERLHSACENSRNMFNWSSNIERSRYFGYFYWGIMLRYYIMQRSRDKVTLFAMALRSDTHSNNNHNT